MKLQQTILGLILLFSLISANPIKPEKATLFHLINQLRQEGCICGKQQFKSAPPLIKNAQLTQAAERHLQDLMQHQKLTHVGADGSSMATRITESGYTWAIIAENMAQNQPSETKVLTYWKQKNGECKNLLNPKFQHIGIAHTEGTWVICFGSPLP